MPPLPLADGRRALVLQILLYNSSSSPAIRFVVRFQPLFSYTRNGSQEKAHRARPHVAHLLLLLRQKLCDRTNAAQSPAREASPLSDMQQTHVIRCQHGHSLLANAQCHDFHRAQRHPGSFFRGRRRARHEGDPRLVLCRLAFRDGPAPRQTPALRYAVRIRRPAGVSDVSCAAILSAAAAAALCRLSALCPTARFPVRIAVSTTTLPATALRAAISNILQSGPFYFGLSVCISSTTASHPANAAVAIAGTHCRAFDARNSANRNRCRSC